MPWSENMIFLAENQYGFSKAALGFPSISACRAIVYQTTEGFFGFHQASGAMPDKFERFGKKFAGFVKQHPKGSGADRRRSSDRLGLLVASLLVSQKLIKVGNGDVAVTALGHGVLKFGVGKPGQRLPRMDDAIANGRT